jgi:predicted nucleotidyltransferase
MNEQEIMLAVQYHHNLVISKGYNVIMTSLVGSQNYGLDHDESDIDTYSLILPSWYDFVHAEDAKAGLIFTEDGHCNFKDIRIALNLLEKTSPNSIEYFTSKYKIYNPNYASVLKYFLEDNDKLYNMIHCNYNHMLYAMAGMAHQLTKRNMPAGKRFSHALRLDSMVYNFFNNKNAKAILDLRSEADRTFALQAKLNMNPDDDKFYNNECNMIASKLDAYKDAFKCSDKQKTLEKEGLKLIDAFRWQIGLIYLKMETNKNNGN